MGESLRDPIPSDPPDGVFGTHDLVSVPTAPPMCPQPTCRLFLAVPGVLCPSGPCRTLPRWHVRCPCCAVPRLPLQLRVRTVPCPPRQASELEESKQPRLRDLRKEVGL